MKKTHIFLKEKIGITLDNKDEDDFELLIGSLNETLSSMYGCHIAYDKTEKGANGSGNALKTTFDGFAIFADEANPFNHLVNGILNSISRKKGGH